MENQMLDEGQAPKAEGLNPTQEKPAEGLSAEERVKALEQELEKLKGSKGRVEEESKGYKSKYQEMKAKLEEFEREKLERNGSLEEKVNFYKTEAEKLQNELKETRTMTAFEKLKNELKSIAPNAHDVDLILGKPDYEDKLAAAIEYDERGIKIDRGILESVVSEDMDKRPFLYKSDKAPKMVDSNAGGIVKDSPKSAKDMTSAERFALISKLREQQNKA